MALDAFNALLVASRGNARGLTDDLEETRGAIDATVKDLDLATRRANISINVADSIHGTDEKKRQPFGLIQAGSNVIQMVQALAADPAARAEVLREITETVEESSYVQTRFLADVMREGFRLNTPTIASQLLPALGAVLLQSMREATPTIAAEVRRVVTEAAPSGKTAAPLPEKCGGGFSPNVMRWAGGLR